jgi:hypothetical protein
MVTLENRPHFNSQYARNTSAALLAAILLFPGATQANTEPATPNRSVTASSIALILPQPASHVVDRRNLLSIRQRSHLGNQLLQATKEDHISIYVLILNEAPEKEIHAYFSEVATRWETKRLVGFIVCLTDRLIDIKTGLHVIPGKVPGEGLLRDNLLIASGNAETIAYRQRNVPDAIESATLELLAQYRSILSGNSPTPVLPEPAPTPTPKTTRPAGISISAALTANWPLLAAGATILLAIGAFIALHLHRRRFVLPIPEYRYRLCAPFSGGNSARTDYRQKHRQPPG